jgi:hypothetical protein
MSPWDRRDRSGHTIRTGEGFFVTSSGRGVETSLPERAIVGRVLVVPLFRPNINRSPRPHRYLLVLLRVSPCEATFQPFPPTAPRRSDWSNVVASGEHILRRSCGTALPNSSVNVRVRLPSGSNALTTKRFPPIKIVKWNSEPVVPVG